MRPRKLSHFKLLELIGSGAIGVVFQALDENLGRTVAIKLLDPKSADENSRKRLLAEAQAASAINHPCVVSIYEIGRVAELDFIVMELVSGKTLADELTDGPLETDRAVRLAAQIADGLAAAHQQGLVHRDLKPGNLMVTDDDRIKILDFGLVKRLALTEKSTRDASNPSSEALTEIGTVLGTPAYMSPEQVRGEAIGSPSDLFSFGCVLYEILTGRRLYAADTPIKSMMAIIADTPPDLGELPSDLALLVGELLSHSPERRPTADQVRDRLQARSMDYTQVLDRLPVKRPVNRLVPGLGLAAMAAVLLILLFRPDQASIDAELPATIPAHSFRLLSETAGTGDGASFSPDAEAIAFLRPDESGIPQIWIMSIDGGQPQMITEGAQPVTGLDWSPRGDRLVFARSGEGIWLMPALGGQAHRIIPSGQRPRFADNGQRILFNDQRLLWLASSDGSDPAPLPHLQPVNFSHLSEGSVSPDGRWIAYFWPHPDRPLGNLWLMPSNGGSPRSLTDLHFLAGGLDWMPDSTSLVFSSDHGGSRNLWQLSLDDQQLRPLTLGTGDDMNPRVSSDGRRIVYTNQRNRYSIKRLDVDTGSQERLLERRMSSFMVEVSRDGGRSTYFGRTPEGFHVFMLDNRTGQTQQLTRGRGEINTHPRWNSQASAVYYYAEMPNSQMRRIDIQTGRDELIVDGWTWAHQGYVSPSPDEQFLAYLRREDGRYLATRIHRLDDGSESELPVPLYGLAWTRDGQAIIGATGATTEGRWIKRCQVPEGPCQRLAQGDFPWLGADESRLYYLRLPGPVAWRQNLDNGQETMLGTMSGFNWLTFNWGMSRENSLIWSAVEFGEKEIWLAEH